MKATGYPVIANWTRTEARGLLEMANDGGLPVGPFSSIFTGPVFFLYYVAFSLEACGKTVNAGSRRLYQKQIYIICVMKQMF